MQRLDEITSGVRATLSAQTFYQALLMLMLMQALALWAVPASATSLDGQWNVPGEKPGEVSAVVRLEPGGDATYRGVIEKLVAAPGEDADRKCSKCAGPKKNQPLKGLEVLWGLKRAAQSSSGAVTYQDGTALDPDEGTTYRCKVVLSADGKSLAVTYYSGIAFLNQTEVWTRAESR